MTVAFFAWFSLLASPSGAQTADASKQYYDNGKLLSEVINNKDGTAVVRSYYKNGDLMEEMKFVDRQSFRHIRYYADGTVAYLSQSTSGPPQNEAVFTLYYPDGSIKMTGSSWNYRLEGEYKEFYPDGELSNKFYYKNNVMVDRSGKPVTGVLNYYFKNGRLMESNSFKNGLPDGPIKFYHPDGYLISETIYNKHHVLSDRIFDREGNVLYEKVNK